MKSLSVNINLSVHIHDALSPTEIFLDKRLHFFMKLDMLKTMFNTKLRRKAYNLYEMHLNYFETKPVKRNQYQTSFSFLIKKFHIQSIPNLQILFFFLPYPRKRNIQSEYQICKFGFVLFHQDIQNKAQPQ